MAMNNITIDNIDSVQKDFDKRLSLLKRQFLIAYNDAKALENFSLNDIKEYYKQILELQTKFFSNPNNKDNKSIKKGQVYFY